MGKEKTLQENVFMTSDGEDLLTKTENHKHKGKD
jgi:hypothetical protein